MPDPPAGSPHNTPSEDAAREFRKRGQKRIFVLQGLPKKDTPSRKPARTKANLQAVLELCDPTEMLP